jgi:hypothetical protein
MARVGEIMTPDYRRPGPRPASGDPPRRPAAIRGMLGALA